MSADNQQERLNENWISGFVDGEGCFHIALNKLSKMSLGYQVLPEFRLVQHSRDIEILKQIKDFLNMGVLRKNHGDRSELRIRKLVELVRLIHFFEEYPLRTKKRKDFELFREVIVMMQRGEHLTIFGLKKIASISAKMNRQRKIFVQNPQRLHARHG